MRPITITALSDTHGKHREISVEPCDILIHAGDISNFNDKRHYIDFFQWLKDQPATHKLLVAGNHDQHFADHPPYSNEFLLNHPDVHYLQNTGLSLMGLNIWGSPVQSDIFKMAFCYNRTRREQEWAKVPNDVDILVSHCPPLGILDMNMDGISTGCDVLMGTIKRVRPKLTLFGHIHEAYGVRSRAIDDAVCTFANCSAVNRWRTIENKPWLFRLENGQVTYQE